MEENGGKRGKMRKLQEGNTGKPKGTLDTESSRWRKVRSRRSGRAMAVGVQAKTVCKGMSSDTEVGVSKGSKK